MRSAWLGNADLITGSARLDLYRKSGDSMLGRYHYYRLHPFSLAEATGRSASAQILNEIPIQNKNEKEIFESLDKFGGFPEPFLRQNMRTLRRWHNEKADRLFKEDTRFIKGVRVVSVDRFLAGLI